MVIPSPTSDTQYQPTADEIVSGLACGLPTCNCAYAVQLGAGFVHCSVHDDKGISLCVSEGPNGETLFRCQAGCPQEAVIDAFRQVTAGTRLTTRKAGPLQLPAPGPTAGEGVGR